MADAERSNDGGNSQSDERAHAIDTLFRAIVRELARQAAREVSRREIRVGTDQSDEETP